MILFLLTKDQAVDAVLARFVPAMKAMPSYEVQVAFKSNHGQLKSNLILDGMKRLFYDATTTSGDRYTLSISPSGYREVERSQKTYDEYPYPGRIRLYSSRISPISETLPSWLLAGDLHNLIPNGSAVKLEGTETLNGEVCDKVMVVFRSRMGNADIQMSVAKSGLVYYYHSVINTPRGKEDDAWTFSRYKPLSNISEARFENRVPDGFTPHSISEHATPVEVDHKADLSGWVDSKTGTVWNPAPGKPVLFVLTSAGSLPSDRAVEAVKKWRSSFEASGAQVAIASDEATRSGAGGLLYNPSQKSVQALGAPSTPMLFLIDGKGMVRNLWMGFAPDGAAKLKQDLLNAIAAAQ